MKFLADTAFPEDVIQQLVAAGHDAEHASGIGAADLPMRVFLNLASFESRVVLTESRNLARLVESAGNWPSVICLQTPDGSEDDCGQLLLNLLPLFDEDLQEGALLIVKESQTLLRKFTRS